MWGAGSPQPRMASSSPSTTARPSAWASTPPAGRPASRRWSPFVKPCASPSAPSPRASPVACRSATSPCGAWGPRTPRGAASSSPMTTSASSTSSASRARPPSCASPRATAAPNRSSGRSSRTCSGSAASPPSRTCAWPCLPPRTFTIGPGSSKRHGDQTPAASTRTAVSHNCGPLHGRPEAVEGRGGAKGNVVQSSTHQTQSWASVSQAMDRIRCAARRDKTIRLTALLHHVNVDLLRRSFHQLKRRAAPGVDGITWHEYEADLEANLVDLHGRVQRGAYRAKPSRRQYIRNRCAAPTCPRAA